jgi:hypothetical protein
MEHFNITINRKTIIGLFVTFMVLYLLYTISYTPNIRIITLPISTQDSIYFTPEGWPLPYPYVAPPSN